jgi:hypothetical protein
MRRLWRLAVLAGALALGCTSDERAGTYVNALDLGPCVPTHDRIGADPNDGPADCVPGGPGGECQLPQEPEVDCQSSPPRNCSFPRTGCDSNGCCLADVLVNVNPERMDYGSLPRSAD